MLHVADKTGRIYKGDRVPVKIIQDNVPLQNYVDEYSSNGKFISYYNAIIPYFGIEGNSVLDEDNHTFHDFGGTFSTKNEGKNLLKLQPVSGVPYGYSGYGTILVLPIKAGHTYFLSYQGYDDSKPFPNIVRAGISVSGVRKITYTDIRPYISSFTYNSYIYLTNGRAEFPGSYRPIKSFKCVKDCILVIYQSNGIEPFINYFSGLMIEEGTARTEYEPYREPQTISVNLSDFAFRTQYGGRSEEPSTINALRKVNENSFDILEIGADDTWMEWDEEMQKPIYGFTRRGVFLHKNVSVINSYAGEDLEGFDWIAAETDAATGLPVIGTTVYVGDYYYTNVYYDTESDAAKELLKLAQLYRTNVIVVMETQDGVSPNGVHASYYAPN